MTECVVFLRVLVNGQSVELAQQQFERVIGVKTQAILVISCFCGINPAIS